MALTVDYSTAPPWLITIPKADLTLESGTKYLLTVDAFWILLRDFTDEINTMAQPVLYSRIPATSSTPSITTIDLNYYELEFEDGLYSVNIINGNTNIREAEVKNQVSVNTNNTTGFIDPTYIQYSTFDGGVWINTATSNTGTIYPVGTPGSPVNNLADALTIAEENGFNIFKITGNLTFDAGDFSAGYKFQGFSPVTTVLTLQSAANLDNCEFLDSYVSGVIDNGNILRECLTGDITSYDGFLDRCGFNGTITLGGSSQTTLVDCFSNIAGGSTPYIDFGGAGSALAVRGYKGGIGISNKTGADDCSIDLTSGQVVLDSTVTAGFIYLRGNGRLTDNSTGTAHIDAEGLVSGTRTIKTVDYVVIEAGGESGTDFPIGTEGHPSNNMTDALIIAARENVTRIHVHDTVTTVSGNDLTGIEIFGQNGAVSDITLAAGTITNKCKILDMTVTGAFNGAVSVLERCVVDAVTDFSGFNLNCFYRNSMSLIGNVAIKGGTLTPDAVNHQFSLDLQGLNVGANFAEWGEGKVLVANMSHVDAYVHLAGTGGKLVVDASCTAGDATYAGSIIGVNNGTPDNFTAVTNASATWDTLLTDASVVADSIGEYINHSLHHLEKTVWIDTEAIPVGDGSQSSPFNDLTTAIDYAEAEGITKLKVYSDIVLDRSLKNFLIEGVGAPAVDCNGQDLTKSEFSHLTLEGSYLGNIVVQACSLINTFTLNGFFENCVLSSTFIIPDGGIALVKNCSTFTTSMVPPVFNIGTVTGTGTLIISGYQGGINIINVNQITDSVRVTDITGRVALDVSNTSGAISLIGTGKVDISNSTSPLTNLMIDPDTIRITNQLLQNKTVTDPATGIMTVYEANGTTVLFTANIWENVAGTEPYIGNAVNRRERFE